MSGNHELTTVTVVVEKRGDRFFIFDGRRFSASFDASAVSVSLSTASAIVSEKRRDSAWRLMLSQSAGRLKRKQLVAVANASNPWRRKCQTWLRSLRWRRNRLHVKRKPSKSYTAAVRPDWISWAGVSMKRLYAIDLELSRRSENPWRVWAQTVSANHRQRERMLNDYKREKESRKAAGQVVEGSQRRLFDEDSG